MPGHQGSPLQLVTLNMDENKVEVNQDTLGRLEKRLRQMGGTRQVAVVSVMGAFRTGKSFLLDLFLRFLRHEEQFGSSPPNAEAPPRGGPEEFPLPEWLTSSGGTIEGASDGSTDGFRFKGGMDACTEGIWVWSEPFLRVIDGKEVALILMDTQGAWDSDMTKEQSATIFGLTAVLSSKQIYNINMQIQEDKVENLAYFMRFAQAALRKAASEMESSGQTVPHDAVEQPFQYLDFLVRDWRHFRKEWTMNECKDQMEQHLSKHLNPKRAQPDSTPEALKSMFERISCTCLPHPGFAIEQETWQGNVNDISNDFIRFIDHYVRDVFTDGMRTKKILGSELSTITFPLVLQDFVNAFHEAAPVAMSFTQAMTNCTVLLAKEQAMKSYQKKMDEATEKPPRGMDPDAFHELSRSISLKIEEEYKRVTIFGSDDTRSETWSSIQDNLAKLHERYLEDNSRRLEKALVTFANITLVGLSLFILDRISDWTCDWWSQTCADLSKMMLLAYACIFVYVGVHVYMLCNEKGRIAAVAAGGELWKEMMRLMMVYGELIQQMNLPEICRFVQKSAKEGIGKACNDFQKRMDAAAKKKQT